MHVTKPTTLMALLAAAALSAPGPAVDLSVILGRPTDRSIAVSVLTTTALTARVEYGLRPGSYTQHTEERTFAAGVPGEFELSALQPNTHYYYCLLTRAGSGDFKPEPEAMFHTQRAPGSTFTFALQGDSHPERLGRMYDAALYALTLRQAAQTPPDFYLTLGDDFSIERLIERQALSAVSVDQVYAGQRGFLGVVGRTAPLFLVNGNHEQAARCNLDGTPLSVAVLAGRSRLRFFPLPAPGAFYSGDEEDIPQLGRPRDYYAWTWGDALFAVIDPYWHSPEAVDNQAGGRAKGGGRGRDMWNSTLGTAQYRWLAKTLTESRARWKFVFAHHVLGTGRGGIEEAGFCEWGGQSRRGSSSFAEKRPGWDLPIHQLMAKTGVTIFFQGHDHLYARQELDGVVYQSCPCPADPTYEAFNRTAYRSGDIRPNSGHLRVTVAPDAVRVDYLRSFLPADEGPDRTNGLVAHSYILPAPRTGTTR